MDLPLDQQNIIALLGIQDLPDDRKIALVQKVTALVEKRLMLRIFDSLSEADQDEFAQLLDRQDQAGADTFLANKISDLAKLLEEETNIIKQQLVDSVSELE